MGGAASMASAAEALGWGRECVRPRHAVVVRFLLHGVLGGRFWRRGRRGLLSLGVRGQAFGPTRGWDYGARPLVFDTPEAEFWVVPTVEARESGVRQDVGRPEQSGPTVAFPLCMQAPALHDNYVDVVDERMAVIVVVGAQECPR